MSTRAKIILLLVLLALDIVAAILAYEATPRTEPGTPKALGLCASAAYVVKFPRGLGPWNTVLIAHNLSTDEYQLPVLVPWPLHEARVWGSSATGWATIGSSSARPLLYGAHIPGPVKTTIYKWSPSDTWLAILPCRARGFNSTELGKAAIIARSEPVDDIVFEAVQPSKIYVANAIPLPLGSNWTHIVLLASPRQLAGIIQLPGNQLLERLRPLIRGETVLEETSPTSLAQLGSMRIYVHRYEDMPGKWGGFGVSYSLVDRRAGYAEPALPVASTYMYMFPRSYAEYSIYSAISEKHFYSITLSRLGGHVSITKLVPERDRLVESSLETILVKGSIFSKLPDYEFIVLSTRKITCKPRLVGTVIPSHIPVRKPGVTLPVYLTTYSFSALVPGDELLVDTRVSGDASIRVLVNGLPVCQGMGGCRASLTYPWLYVVLSQVFISAEPLEVTILVNQSTTLTMLNITQRACLAIGGDNAPKRIVTIEPINPSTLSPLGLVLLAEHGNQVNIVHDALGALVMDAEGAKPNITILELLDTEPAPVTPGLVERLVQPHINWIVSWEPFLATINYVLTTPFIVIKDNRVVIHNHVSALFARIEYSVATGTKPILVLKYSAPGIESTSIQIPLTR